MTNPDDLRRVAQETRDRLTSLGVELDGQESSDELTEIQDAIEQFENAVTAKGGDLMVDEGSPGRPPDPDDPHFGLPTRKPDEDVKAFVERIKVATDRIRRHPPLE